MIWPSLSGCAEQSWASGRSTWTAGRRCVWPARPWLLQPADRTWVWSASLPLQPVCDDTTSGPSEVPPLLTAWRRQPESGRLAEGRGKEDWGVVYASYRRTKASKEESRARAEMRLLHQCNLCQNFSHWFGCWHFQGAEQLPGSWRAPSAGQVAHLH